MADVDDFIAQVLEHAESRYDPVKAREYYLRTRELKGRRSGSGLKSDAQKEGWEYTKSEVEKERKEALESAAESNKQAVAQLRANGDEKRQAIQEKLRAIMERLSAKIAKDQEDLSAKVQAEIDALPPIPKGLSKAEVAARMLDRQNAIAKIRGDAQKASKDLSTGAKSARDAQRDNIVKERQQLSTDIKGSLDKARETYKAAREAIAAQYETELDTEYDAIRTNVR